MRNEMEQKDNSSYNVDLYDTFTPYTCSYLPIMQLYILHI